MSSADGPTTRRRRRRGHRPAGPADPAPPVTGSAAPVDPPRPERAEDDGPPAARPDRRRAPRTDGGRRRSGDGDRGWRELAGNSPSQVGVSGALRARDVARPAPEDLTAAEQNLVIMRRQWTPPPEPER